MLAIQCRADSHRFPRWADELIKFNFNRYFEFYSIDKADHRPNLFFSPYVNTDRVM